jgi:hypothetical protein
MPPVSDPHPTASSPTELTREPAPGALVVDGRYRFGTYDAPIATINPLDVAGRGRRAAFARAVRHVRLKEWEAFQLGNDEWFVLGAVYDAKLVSLLQVIAVHTPSGRIHRWERKVPTTSMHVARGLSGTRTHGRVGDFAISLGNEVGEGHLSVDATHPGRGHGAGAALPGLELHGVGHCGPGDAAHLVICHPFGDDRALYSDKCMMPFEGSLRIGAELVSFERDSSFMILDDHHGDYPSPMQYDWVTGARRLPDGTLQGFNLTDNQVRDPELHNENAVWIDNRVHRLPAVHVERPDGPWGVWHVRDEHGRVDVRFLPSVRSEMHVGPRRSLAEYYAPYGRFEGTIRYGSGAASDVADGVLDVGGCYGVGEQKLIRL